jgi:hypothetical protein
MIIRCYVQTLSQYYADGLPRVEVFVITEDMALVSPMPAGGQEIAVTVVTTTGNYDGAIRNESGKGWPYICPDLYTNGSKVSLARVLRENGVSLSSGQPVTFDVSGSTWTLVLN